MAPASSTLAADEATIGGRGGRGTGGRTARRAKLAAGVATLGCAAALALGGLRASTAAPTRAVTAGWEQHDYAGRMHFLEWNTHLPDGTLPTTPVSVEQQRFLDLNTQLPSAGAPALIPPGPANFPGDKY